MKRKLAALAALIAVWLAGVSLWIALGQTPAEAAADTAIVLGAAVDGRRPTPVFAARIDHAIDLYRQGRVTNVLFTGGKSPEDALSEAEAAAAYAIARGVPARDILLETRSRTTRENIRYAANLLSSRGAGRVLIVTDPLHMRRAMAMARDQGLYAAASPALFTRYRSAGTQIPFLLREVFFMHVYWLTGR